MRLSDEQREIGIAYLRNAEKLGALESCSSSGELALDLADELAAAQAHAERFMRDLRKAERREKRLKRQVELMGWLIQSHEADIHELAGYAKVRGGWPSFDQMGDPSDEGEYTDDDLDMLKDHWPAAREELERRQMADDNHDHRDDAARQAWGESR